MSVRQFVVASVSAAFLAATAAVSGSAAASTQSTNLNTVQDAYRALQAGNARGAVVAYTLAIESRTLPVEPLANALLNRALAYQHMGEHGRAIDDYTAALRLDAMSAKLRATALYNRALSHQKSNQAAQAIEDYTSALFLDSEFAAAYFNRAGMLRTSGQYLFALSDYEKARRYRFPDEARVHYNEALTYKALQRPAQARKSLELALSAKPNYVPAWQMLAGLGETGRETAGKIAADDIVTGSITNTGPDLTIAKPAMPEPVAPPGMVMADAAPQVEAAAAAAGQRRKLITDRLPQGGDGASPAAVLVEPAPAQQTALVEPAGIQVAEPEEKIIAIEPVPEEPEQAGATPQKPAAEAQAPSGWSVQIASASSEDAAWSVWNKMKSRFKSLRGKDPVVVRADLGTKGVFYRVRFVGYDDQGAAKSDCSRLKAGGVSCFVSRADS